MSNIPNLVGKAGVGPWTSIKLLITRGLSSGSVVASTAVLDVIKGRTYGDSIVGRTQGDVIKGRTYGDSIVGHINKDG